MEEHKASVTAMSAAFLRVFHFSSESQHIFADPFAQRLLSDEEQSKMAPLQVEAFAHLFPELGDDSLSMDDRLRALVPRLGIATEVLSRAVFAERVLREAASVGVGQYVLLGAGFDTFSLREPALARTLAVFEVDHPATQAEKRSRLEAAGLHLADDHHFVPVDFERDDLGAALDAAGYRREAPAVFSWLGVTPYLTPAAIAANLANLARIAAPSSEIVFDYAALADDASPAARAIAEALAAAVAELGESFESSFTGENMAAVADDAGWEVIEDIGPAEIGARFVPHSLSHYADPDFIRYMHLRRA